MAAALVAAALVAAGAVVGPAAAQERPVLLEIRPRERDTLRVRFEQEVEMSAPVRLGSDSIAIQRSTMLVLSRSIVETVGAAGATVVAVTDSVALSATGADPRALDAARRAMQGRRSRLRVTPSGASEVLTEGGRPGGDGDAPHARFPGTLPTDPVAVGATWTREMPLPMSGPGRPGGKLAVEFRLDSLGGGGGLAHVSMRGALSRQDGPNAQGARAATTGKLTGALLVDLRRGWMVDSRTTFMLTTVVTPPASQRVAPAHVKLRVTQRLRGM